MKELISFICISFLLYLNGTSLSLAYEPVDASHDEFLGENTIANLVEKIEPSIVDIESIIHKSGRSFRPRTDNRPNKFKHHFGIESEDEVDIASDYLTVTGSGVIVDTDGKILTNLHVIENASKITVTLSNGESFIGSLVAKDDFSDLALLKIEKTHLPVIKFGDANKLRVGQWVVAIGNQFGLGHTVSHGLISGLKREAKAFASMGAKTGTVRFIQTDAPINPGSSGGPLINLQGQVIGINTFIRDDAQNIGFAIPSNYAKEIADKLIALTAIVHPYIGIEMYDPKANTSEQLNGTERQSGVQISKVKKNSPAEAAGLKAGDWILALNDNVVKTPDDISQLVSKQQIGAILRVSVDKNGANEQVNVKVDALPSE